MDSESEPIGVRVTASPPSGRGARRIEGPICAVEFSTRPGNENTRTGGRISYIDASAVVVAIRGEKRGIISQKPRCQHSNSSARSYRFPLRLFSAPVATSRGARFVHRHNLSSPTNRRSRHHRSEITGVITCLFLRHREVAEINNVSLSVISPSPVYLHMRVRSAIRNFAGERQQTRGDHFHSFAVAAGFGFAEINRRF